MLSTALIAFREILEVALILGVILAATQGVAGRTRWVGIGLLAGVGGSIVLALFAEQLSNAAEGMGQELFNAGVLFTASAMIGWTVIWMRKHGRAILKHAQQLAAGVVEGSIPLYSVAVVIALATLREGSEIVLFTYGMMAGGTPLFAIGAGLVLGLVAGGIVGVLMYYGLIKISTRHIFTVTSWLLVLVAAGMASAGAKYLTQAGHFAGLSSPLWDSSFLLSEDSLMGQMFHALLGYSSQPMGIQLVFYGVTLTVLIVAMRLVDRRAVTA